MSTTLTGQKSMQSWEALPVFKRVRKFFSQFQECQFATGDILVRSGEVLHWVYYLESGIVKQTATSAEGQELIITLYKPGAFFPLIWAVKPTPVAYDFQAVTECKGWRAPKEAVLTFLQQNPTVTFDLCTRLLSGLEGLSRKVEYALQASATWRVGEALLMLAARLGQVADKQSSEYLSGQAFSSTPIHISLSLTHQELARITGLTRETVTRELKTLKNMGLVSMRQKTFILNKPSVLAQLVGLE